MVQVVLLKDICDEKAEELVKRCPANVFDIEDTPTGIICCLRIDYLLETSCQHCNRSSDDELLLPLPAAPPKRKKIKENSVLLGFWYGLWTWEALINLPWGITFAVC